MKFKTAAEAWAFTHKHREDAADPHCAGRQFEARQLVDGYRERHESGDTTALPYALATCAHHGLVMPDWLADAVYGGIVRWHNFETRTLDDAIGVSRKGQQAPGEMNYRAHCVEVFMQVITRVRDGRPVEPDLFEEISEDMNAKFSGATCSRWFYRYLDETPVASDWYEHYKNNPARKKLSP